MKLIICIIFFFGLFLFAAAFDIPVTIADEGSLLQKMNGRILNIYFIDSQGEIRQFSFLIGTPKNILPFVCKQINNGTYRVEAFFDGAGWSIMEKVDIKGAKPLRLRFAPFNSAFRGKIVYDHQKFALIKAEVLIRKKDRQMQAENQAPLRAYFFHKDQYIMEYIPSGFYQLELIAEFVLLEKKDNYDRADIRQVKRGIHLDLAEKEVIEYDFILTGALN